MPANELQLEAMRMGRVTMDGRASGNAVQKREVALSQ